MKVIHFKNRMLPFFFSQWSHEGISLHIVIILASPWQRPCFSIGWQSAPRSVHPVPSSVLKTLTTAGGDDPDSKWQCSWLRGGAISRAAEPPKVLYFSSNPNWQWHTTIHGLSSWYVSEIYKTACWQAGNWWRAEKFDIL